MMPEELENQLAQYCDCGAEPHLNGGAISSILPKHEGATRAPEPLRECRRLRILAVIGDLKYGKRKQSKETYRDTVLG